MQVEINTDNVFVYQDIQVLTANCIQHHVHPPDCRVVTGMNVLSVQITPRTQTVNALAIKTGIEQLIDLCTLENAIPSVIYAWDRPIVSV